MKLFTQCSPTIASDEIRVSKMGMDESSTDLIQYFLRDKIYSNKILAVVREYICNAIDEHRKYAIDKEVEVSLFKVEGEWTWSVRDFAMGLSDEDIRNVFSMYGNSTKRNNNLQVGSFGLGSKSFHCYTDTFYVKSHYNGILTTYACVLGGGVNGVSIGETYEISQEPTTETGLEVSGVVDKNARDFLLETTKFVNIFSHTDKIVFKHNANADSGYYTSSPLSEILNVINITPNVPVRIKQLDEFTFNLFESGTQINASNPTYGSSVFLRMGGVVYEGIDCRHIATFVGPVIVDLPIGCVSLPISRESIEDTDSNKKVFEKIRSLIKNFLEEDRKVLSVPDFADMIVQPNYKGNDVDSDWFSYNFRASFPDSYNFINYLSRREWGTIPKMASGKQIIYVLPNIKNTGHWLQRLELFLTSLPNPITNFQYAVETAGFSSLITTPSDSLDLKNIEFMYVKKMGLPRLPKADKEEKEEPAYVVYRRGSSIGTFTAEGLEEYTLDLCGTESDNWIDSVKTREQLNSRTIAPTNLGGIRNGHGYFVANSIRLIDALTKEMGWITPTSDVYKNKLAEIVEVEKIASKQLNAKNHATQNYFYTEIHPNVVKAIGKDMANKKLNKLKAIKNKLIAEDSLRGRILKKIDRGYSDDRYISRKDLREIMKLK